MHWGTNQGVTYRAFSVGINVLLFHHPSSRLPLQSGEKKILDRLCREKRYQKSVSLILVSGSQSWLWSTSLYAVSCNQFIAPYATVCTWEDSQIVPPHKIPNICIVELKRMAFLKTCDQQMPRSSRTPDWKIFFNSTALDSNPMLGPANLNKLGCKISLTPSRCPVPSKCHQSSARRGTFPKYRKSKIPRGPAEYYWQSSTWSLTYCTLVQCTILNMQIICKSKLACLQNIYMEVAVSLSQMWKSFHILSSNRLIAKAPISGRSLN